MTVSKSKKKMLTDFIINLGASFLLTIVTQLITYPLLSQWMDNGEYGLLLTVMGIVNVVGSSLGNPLNNARILSQKEYDEKNLTGDFNIFSYGGLILSYIISLSICFAMLKNASALYIALISTLVFFRSYFSVEYRLHINFKKIFLCNVVSVCGYGIGLAGAYFSHVWYLPFILGEFSAILFILFTTKLIREPAKKTELFKSSTSRYLFYLLATSISLMMTYFDRFFLYPTLGEDTVAVYSVASVFGKMVGLVITPITSVFLTYYSKETGLSVSNFRKRILLFSVLALVAYGGILILGEPVLRLLYPTLADSALPFLNLASLASIILYLGNSIMPSLLRYCKPIVQPVLEFIFVASYAVIALIFIQKGGLKGFCYAGIISNTLRLILLITMGEITLRKINKNTDRSKEND